MREVRVGGWILVTTLADAGEVSKRELFELYCARWQIELDLRSIKTVMQMEVLRCKSPQMVCKEIAVYMLAYKSGARGDGAGGLPGSCAGAAIEFQGSAANAQCL